jgi:hypothetical protein
VQALVGGGSYNRSNDARYPAARPGRAGPKATALDFRGEGDAGRLGVEQKGSDIRRAELAARGRAGEVKGAHRTEPGARRGPGAPSQYWSVNKQW